jgi:dolichol-phosphate mannosyltransferase
MRSPSKHGPSTSSEAVVIPARDEDGYITALVKHLDLELRLHGIEHEIIVVDDGSTDSTWTILCDLKRCR